MTSLKQHGTGERRLYTHRLSALSLLTLAFFIPAAAGCSDQQPAGVDDIEADTTGDQADDTAPLSAQFPTSQMMQEATGMTYFTVAEVGENLEVRGFLPDGTEAASIVFEDREPDLYATLSEPGKSPQVMIATTAFVPEGMQVYGSLDGQPFSILRTADGESLGAEMESFPIHDKAALLMAEFGGVQNDSTLRRQPRWWACTKCAGGIVVVSAALFFIIKYAPYLLPWVRYLVGLLKAGPVMPVRDKLIELGVAAGLLIPIVIVLEKLAQLANHTVDSCVECWERLNPPPPPPVPPQMPPAQDT
jgi:hypothetical protein